MDGHPNAEIWREAVENARQKRIEQASKLGLPEDDPFVTDYVNSLMQRAAQRAGHPLF